MNTPNKKSAYSPAVTILITTASIAAALTGWAIFSNKDAASDASATTTAAVAAVPSNSFTVAATPKPLPTLVPLIGTTPLATTAAAAPPSVKSQAQQVLPTVQPPAPTAQQPARNVSGPAPRPLTRSRSSR